MKAGIDFGLTHVKAHWISTSGEYNLLSTMDGFDRRGLANELRHRYGITVLCAAGNGPTDGFDWFPQHRLQGDPLTLEIRTQASGAHRLLTTHLRGSPIPHRYHLISVGTGVSYVFRNGDAYAPLLGSAFGAGAVDGLLAAVGIASGPRIDELLVDGPDEASLDLMLAEAVPALKGTFYEAFTAAHFAKAAREPPAGQEAFDKLFASSVVNMLVVDAARSLLLHDRNPACRLVPDAAVAETVVLGTLPSRSRVVRRRLEKALRMIGKDPIFPPHGEYALAVGAYHAIEI
ncbi:MAG TPA: hypothetical protein VL283_02605 [Candidatus Baltobacteraceae bacterium]|nr:hypothetical protein [Candidatus Baltobacteraceae bacterium]